MAAAGHLLCLLLLLALLSWGLGKKDPMDRRFSDLKRCVDEECSMLLCRGKAVQDFTGPDCRFINIKKGETIYVYYKLAGRSTELWAGSIGSNFGYFPSYLLEINHVYTEEERELPTDETDFVCFEGGTDNFDNYNVDDLLKSTEQKENTNEGFEPLPTESVELEPGTDHSTELKEDAESKSSSSPQIPSEDEADLVANMAPGGTNEETLPGLTREEHEKLQRADIASDPSGFTEQEQDPKSDLFTESPTKRFQEDTLQQLEEKPPVPSSEFSDNMTNPRGEPVLAEEQLDDFEGYTLVDKETFANIKTQLGSTADAVVTNEEMTNLITSVNSDIDEYENKNDEEEDLPVDLSKGFNETPLLKDDQEENLLSKESSLPNTPEEYTVDVPKPSHIDLETGVHTEKSESQNNIEEKEDENLLTTWGDTIFAIVSGGEHTKEVTDLNRDDSDEDKDDDEGDVTESNNAGEGDNILLIGMQETEVKEKESMTDKDLERFIDKFGLEENTSMVNGHSLDDVVPENEQVDSDNTDRAINKKHSIGPDGASQMESDIDKSVNNGEDPKGVEQQTLEKLDNKDISESNVRVSEEFPKHEADADENENKDVPEDKVNHIVSTDNLETGKPVHAFPEKDDDILDFHKYELKPVADLTRQEEKESSSDVKEANETILEAETEDTISTFGQKNTKEADTVSVLPEGEHDETSEGNNRNEEKAGSSGGRLTTTLTADDAEDENLKEPDELLEDENAASALKSEQTLTLKRSQENSLSAGHEASELEMREEMDNVFESKASEDSLEPEREDVKIKNEEIGNEDPIKTGEVQKGEDGENIDQTPDDEKQNKKDVIDLEHADVATVEHNDIVRVKLDDGDGKVVVEGKVHLTVEDPVQEVKNSQQESSEEEYEEHEQYESSEGNSTDVEPEYSDSVKELALIRKYLEEQQLERLMKYLEQPNILRLEAMFHDMESELKLARMGDQLQDHIEKALDQILESSETTILGFVEKVLEERAVGNEELLEKERNIFDDEAALLDDIQEVAYRLRQKYSTVVYDGPLPPEVQISEMDPDSKISEAEEDIDSKKELLENELLENDLKRPPWFPADLQNDLEPDMSLFDDTDALPTDETDESNQTQEEMNNGEGSLSVAKDPTESLIPNFNRESLKDPEMEESVADSAAESVDEELLGKKKKRPPWFKDMKLHKTKSEQPATIAMEDHNIVENTKSFESSQTGESEDIGDMPSFEKIDLEHSSTGDSSAVHEENEQILSGALIAESLESIVFTTMNQLTMLVLALLPEHMQPGPNFHGIPWTPILVTILVGVLSIVIFFWRTCLSVKSRIYQVNEKQLAEKIKNLMQEKTDILQKISDYEQKIKDAEESVQEAQKANTNLSAEALELKEIVKGLEDTNQQLGGKVKNLQAQLESERQQSMKSKNNILETQKSVEKLQEVLTQHSVELSEVQIALSEAKLSEQKIKSDLHCVQEENGRLQKSKEQLLKEAEGWGERHSELSEQIGIYQKSQKDMEEALSYKENEIEVLSNCIMQLKQLDAFCESEPQAVEGNGWDKGSGDLANGDCSDSRNEKMKTQIKQMMDVSRVKTTLSIVEEDRDLLQIKLKDEVSARYELEEQIEKLEHETGALQTAKAHLDNECKTLRQKVEILNELYQQKEMALQKKLTQEEYERQEKAQKLTVADEKAVLATEEVKVYKQRIQEMEEELQKTERSYKNQIAGHEKKAHDNWLIARSAERSLSEEKRESANLRQKLIEVNQKIAMLQRPSIVKPTPGRPDYPMAGQRGPRSRDGSFGPSPVSGGAPSPPLMVEASSRPSSTNLTRRDGTRGGVDSGPRQPHEISGRMSAPDLGPSRMPSSGPRTSSPANVVDGMIIPGPKGPLSYPGPPIMNSPMTGPLHSQPPARFGPLPARFPYGVRPMSAPLVRGPPLPLGPRDYIAGPAPGMRELPHGPHLPPPPDGREYIRGPLGPSGHRDYPVGPPPPLIHGPRDYPPGLSRDLLPPGARDYLPGPPGPRNYPGGPPLVPRDYPGGPPHGPRDFPGSSRDFPGVPPPGPRNFPGGPPSGSREYPLGPSQSVRDFTGGPPPPREYLPGLPQGSRDYQLRPQPGPPPEASIQRDNAHSPEARP